MSNKSTSNKNPASARRPEGAATSVTYEAPRVTKKRSVARVTLFSGGGPMAGGLVATGG